MSGRDDQVEQSNKAVRPWIFGLWAVIVVGYGGFTLTRSSGWSIAFSVLMVIGGLVVIVVTARELIRYRRARR